MKKFLFLLTFLALGLITSCQKDDYFLEVAQPETNPVVTASLETAVRTQLDFVDGVYKTIWSANDAISFIYKGKHYKYDLSEGGAGKVTADFEFNPFFGTISGSIESEINNKLFIGAYPFSTETKVAQNDNDITIKTAIPAQQVYSPNSFGQEASPMVAVAPYVPDFSFKNLASCLVLPLKGEGKIFYATLESKTQKIAGAVAATVVVNDDYSISLPTVTATEDGVQKIILACGENGVELNSEEATDFFFVLAPGTYEANDLVVTFYDKLGNYFKTEITATNNFERSKVLKLKNARTFEIQGTEDVDLWLKAIAPAYAQAERVIPSLNDVNIEEWIKGLANHDDDIVTLIERVMLASSMGDYKKVYEILGGIPGFTKETRTFEVTGVAKREVIYDYVDYINDKIAEVNNIQNVDEFLAYINKHGLDKYAEEFGTIGDWVEKFGITSGDGDELIEEEKYKQKRAQAVQSVKDELAKLEALTVPADLESKRQSNIEKAQAFLSNEPNLSNNEFETAFKALYLEGIRKQTGTQWFIPIYTTYYSEYSGLLKWASFGISDWLGELTGSSLLEDVMDINVLKYLQDNANNKDSLTYKLLSMIFDNEEFLASMKQTLADIVAEIQQNEDVNTNIGEKNEQIAATLSVVIDEAQNDAFNKLNQAMVDASDNRLWSLFKTILGKSETVNLFKKYNLIDVHTALENLCTIIDSLISYDKVGKTVYSIDKDSYVEDVHYWVYQYEPQI